jgi:phage-related tail fiber protein
MPATYYAILTTLGATRLAEAVANAIPLVFAFGAVGDGGGAPITPAVGMTTLVNERARVAINKIETSPDEPNVLRVEFVLLAATGGFTIREAGLFNLAGEMIAVASYPPTYKPVPADGAIVNEYIRVLIAYTPASAVALTVDPNVITATELYVDDATAGGLANWERFS